MKRILLFTIASLAAGIIYAGNFTPAQKAHPRLIIKDGDIATVRTHVSQDSIAPTKDVEPFVLPNTPRHSFDTDNKGSLRVGFYTQIPGNKSKTLKIELVPIVN